MWVIPVLKLVLVIRTSLIQDGRGGARILVLRGRRNFQGVGKRGPLMNMYASYCVSLGPIYSVSSVCS